MKNMYWNEKCTPVYNNSFRNYYISAVMAHLLERPHKLVLSKTDYANVQNIYGGWSRLGIFEIGALVLTGVWAFLDRRKKRNQQFLSITLGCFVLSMVLFFMFTFPANKATLNWTHLPDHWEMLRNRWEYSHAVRAVINLIGAGWLIGVLLKSNSRSYPIRY